MFVHLFELSFLVVMDAPHNTHSKQNKNQKQMEHDIREQNDNFPGLLKREKKRDRSSQQGGILFTKNSVTVFSTYLKILFSST